MENTVNLALPYLMASQAQKHVTHNEALRMLDALVQLSVASAARTAPPSSPAEGERHIVAAGATGAWQGHDGGVACHVDGGWLHFSPRPGWLAYVEDEDRLLVHRHGAWTQPGEDAAAQLDGLGIRTGADAVNRLAVKSDAVLFSHDDVTPGSGDMRVTLNRDGDANDAGFVFQSGWSSRALFGLLGDAQFRIKVSPDGGTFHDAVAIDPQTGAVALRAARPAADDAHSLGSASHRWSVVHAATGTISTSDRRQKEDIDTVPVGLDFVRGVDPVSYRLKGGTRTHFGLIAQQVKELLDEHEVADFAGWTLADPADPDSRQGLRYDEFVPILVRAIQELAAEVELLRRAA